MQAELISILAVCRLRFCLGPRDHSIPLSLLPFRRKEEEYFGVQFVDAIKDLGHSMHLLPLLSRVRDTTALNT